MVMYPCPVCGSPLDDTDYPLQHCRACGAGVCPACGEVLRLEENGLPVCRGDCAEIYAERQAENAADYAALEAAGCICGGCRRADGPALDTDPALQHAADRLLIYGCCCV